MGIRRGFALTPTWCQSLDAMIAGKIKCRARCTKCKEWRDVDLEALREKVGGSFSLWNRQQRKCRLTPGCEGRNRFDHNGYGGFYFPMRDRHLKLSD